MQRDILTHPQDELTVLLEETVPDARLASTSVYKALVSSQKALSIFLSKKPVWQLSSKINSVMFKLQKVVEKCL